MLHLPTPETERDTRTWRDLDMPPRRSAVRDYAIAATVFAVVCVFGVQAVIGLVESVRQNVRVETASIAGQQQVVRNYQVTRSVIDDSVVTGSITKGPAATGMSTRPVILDPCTGAVKDQ